MTDAIYYYQESFIEKLFRYLVPVLEYIVVCFALAGLLIIQQGDKEIEELQKTITKEQNISLLIKKIPPEEVPEAKIPELAIVEEDIVQTKKETEMKEVLVEETKVTTLKKVTEEEIMSIPEIKVGNNYNPTEEERNFAYRVAWGEAGIEGSMGQILVINAAINHMKEKGYSNLTEEFEAAGRFSCVINGQVYNCEKIVNVEDVPQEVKDAVDSAFENDYTEELLKKQAESLGITDEKYWKGGATYFYNPKACSEHQNSLRENIKVKFQYGHHIFYRYWDK